MKPSSLRRETRLVRLQKQAYTQTSLLQNRSALWILISVCVLVSIGLLMVGSASMSISAEGFGSALHYLFRQSFFILLSALLAIAVYFLCSVSFLRDKSLFLLFFVLILLILVLVPGIGHVVNGSRRWIPFIIFSFQVSEFAKLIFILYMADYISRQKVLIRGGVLLRPLILLGLVGLLLLLEPDFGSLTVLTITTFLLLFIGRASLLPFLSIFGVAISGLVCLAIFSPYRLERIISFLHPWSDPFGSGYQLTQSLIAFGRGGVLGAGLGNSVQKLLYLPEAHTDFIFAVIAEEFGLIGCLVVLFFFFMLIFHLLKTAVQIHRTQLSWSALVLYGASFWWALQVCINIGVCTGLLPTKGLTLPWISYGGSSLLVNGLLLGIIFRILKMQSEKER